MKNFYEVGRVYIWQNICNGYQSLNGTETTVTGNVEILFGHQCQATDTLWNDGYPVYAIKGSLRPKNPPPGEQSIRDLFKLPELEPA